MQASILSKITTCNWPSAKSINVIRLTREFWGGRMSLSSFGTRSPVLFHSSMQ